MGSDRSAAGNRGGELSPGPHAELAQGTRHVILDGARTYPEPGRDLGIGQAAGDEVRHITLSWGQARPAERGPPARAPSPACHHGGLPDAEPGAAFPRGLRLLAELLAARGDPA